MYWAAIISVVTHDLWTRSICSHRLIVQERIIAGLQLIEYRSGEALSLSGRAHVSQCADGKQSVCAPEYFHLPILIETHDLTRETIKKLFDCAGKIKPLAFTPKTKAAEP